MENICQKEIPYNSKPNQSESMVQNISKEFNKMNFKVGNKHN